MYSPKIAEEHIPKLYYEAKRRKIPMTRLVNEIIAEKAESYPQPITTKRR